MENHYRVASIGSLAHNFKGENKVYPIPSVFDITPWLSISRRHGEIAEKL